MSKLQNTFSKLFSTSNLALLGITIFSISLSTTTHAIDIDKLFDEPSKIIRDLFINLVDRVLMWSGFIAIIGTILHWLYSTFNSDHVKIGKYLGIIITALAFISFGFWLKNNGVSLFQ